MTQLNKLFGMLHIPCEDERVLLGISDDSRVVEKDWLYVCWHVSEQQKQQYVEEARSKGAVVLCEKGIQGKEIYTCASIEHISQALIELYYGDLCKGKIIVGITGTNGKTSVASFLTQVLEASGKRIMRIGTKEVEYAGKHLMIRNTTPDRFELAALFDLAWKEEMDGIVMEVSSHAIDKNRICFISYDCIIYTNITQDHLDYHLTKTHYRFTKFKLRRYLKEQGLIIYPKDRIEMRELVQLYHGPCLSIGEEDAHLCIHDIILTDHDASFSIENHRFHTHLLGMINVHNMACVIAAARRFGQSFEELMKTCELVRAVPGRMEVLKGKNALVWIDFAHTPDALQNLLSFAQSVKKGNIITIIGCGGDRDRKKRALMGDIVACYSDLALYTADNPRGEDLHGILMDMMAHPHANVEIFENRSFAIKHAVKCAQNSDIIIIAGKGNEATQIIGDHCYPFSDREIVQKRLCEEENH